VLSDNGRAAVIMPGGSLFRSGAEEQVRAEMVNHGVVEAIIALPPQMFVSTAVPVTLWLLRPPAVPVNLMLSSPPAVPIDVALPRLAEWRIDQKVLFVEASGLGHMISRTQQSLSDEERRRIVDTVERWREGEGYEDVPGFSASVGVERVSEQDYVLVPARYVNAGVGSDTSIGTARELRNEVAALERHAAAVNAAVERRLDGIRTWIR